MIYQNSSIITENWLNTQWHTGWVKNRGVVKCPITGYEINPTQISFFYNPFHCETITESHWHYTYNTAKMRFYEVLRVVRWALKIGVPITGFHSGRASLYGQVFKPSKRYAHIKAFC